MVNVDVESVNTDVYVASYGVNSRVSMESRMSMEICQ